jgi:glutamate dehydrogenase (NAD(P)+)
MTLVGVGDVTGGRHDPSGIDLSAVCRAVDAGESLADAPAGELVDAAELLELACDALVPAAVGGVIDAANAERIDARLVVEGANGPTTREAAALLADRGVVVVPDVLANAGGVIASHLESVQGVHGTPLTGRETESGVAQRLRGAFSATCVRAEADGGTLREAALCIAVDRVATAHRTLGLYP